MKPLFLFFLVFILLSGLSHGSTIDINTQGPIPPYYSELFTNGTSVNLIGDYSNDFTWAYIEPAPNTTLRIHRILITLADTGINNADEYGATNALTRGISIWINQSGNLRRIDAGLNVTRNWNYHVLAYDVDDSNSLANGEDALGIRWTLANSGTAIRLNGSNMDRLLITLHDDFSGLSGHYFTAQGYNETEKSIGLSNYEEVDDMGIEHSTIMLLPLLMAALNIGLAFFLNVKEHNYMRLFLIVAGLTYIFPAIGFGYLAVNDVAPGDWVSNLTSFLWMTIVNLTIFVTYLALYMLTKLMRRMVNEKEGDFVY